MQDEWQSNGISGSEDFVKTRELLLTLLDEA